MIDYTDIEQLPEPQYEIEKMLYQDNVHYETRNRVARIIRRNFGDE